MVRDTARRHLVTSPAVTSFRAPHRIGRLLLLASLFCLVALTHRAMAETPGSAPKRMAIHADGPEAAALKEELVRLMPATVEVVAIDFFAKAMSSSGLPREPGTLLASRGGKKSLALGLKKALDKAELDGAVLARKKPGRKPAVMLLFVERGADTPRVDETVAHAGGERAEALEGALGSALRAFAPPPARADSASESEAAERVRERDEAARRGNEPEFVAHRAGAELFEVTAGLELGARFFGYHEGAANTANTRPYEVLGVPGLAVGGVVYPAATTDVPVARDLGVFVRYAHFFGLSSQTADVRVFDTSFNRFTAGLRYRLRFGDDADPGTVGAFGAFGFENFTFTPRDDRGVEIASELADVKYRTLKGGLDARIPLGVVALTPSLAYVGALEGGPVYERFREPTLRGLEAALDLALVVGSGVELRLGGDYTRYFASFAPLPDDEYSAEGADDQLVHLHLEAAYVF